MSVNMKQSGNLIPIASLTKAIIPLGFADCYSTEERQVGCFVDGKPVYQKTIDTGALPNNTTKNVNHNISDIDTVVTAFGFAKASGINWIPIPFVNNTAYTDQVALFVNPTTITLRTSGDRSAYGQSYVTIQYTKTTDTAGSGIWTPDGTPAHHYSLTEHIIGTWYDGSTLYEKTKVIPFSSFNVLSSGWRYTYNFRGSNEDVKKIEAYANSPSYGKCFIGVRNYESNSTMSNYYFELDNYYSTLNLNFVGNNASVIGVTEVVITYQYTKTA